jgi:hypothetical protein
MLLGADTEGDGGSPAGVVGLEVPHDPAGACTDSVAGAVRHSEHRRHCVDEEESSSSHVCRTR